MKRTPQLDLAPRECPTCGARYQPYRSTQRACSRKCREALGPVPEADRPHEVEFECKLCGKRGVARTTIRGGRRNYCDDCQADAARLRADRKNANRSVARAKDPEARRLANRRTNLRRYGLTPEQHDAMLAEQGGVCLLCGDGPDPNGTKAQSRLHVDHDHKTGRVRGLLCGKCNAGVGYFRDDPELMQRASLYVWKHRQLAG